MFPDSAISFNLLKFEDICPHYMYVKTQWFSELQPTTPAWKSIIFKVLEF
jgi:hypothetical protein